MFKLPTDLMHSALRETVEEQLETKEYNINVSSASEEGGNNFIGVVYRASFSKRNGDEVTSENDQIHNVVIKTAPQNIKRREICLARPYFLREIYIYDKVLPALRRFEQSKGVTPEIGFSEYPNCYRTVDIEPSECLILEDLSVRGFHMLDRYNKEITVEHALLLMRSLGKFHAISFAMKDQQAEQFNELISSMDENFLNKRTNYLMRQSKHVENVLSREEDAHLLARVEKLLGSEFFTVAANCIDPEVTGFAVVTHADTWQNNLMFRYDESEKPIGISLLDWQISRYSTPITDIVYFIFCCTTKELRDKHYDDFLNTYYASLSTHIRRYLPVHQFFLKQITDVSEFVNRLGSDPEKLFSYEMMQEQLRKFGRYGLIMAAILLPVVTKEAGNSLNLDDLCNKSDFGIVAENSMISDNSRGNFEKRLRDVIIDMVRLEYI